jgi:hypothetical protein
MPSRSLNSSLNKAKGARQDEFYTQLPDIEAELRHYRQHFRGKSVLCNCDDPFESNFFRYFALNFNRLGLKRLVATCYAGSPITGTQLSLFGDETEEERRTPYKAVVTSVRDATGDGATSMDDVAELFRTGENELSELEGDGDFRSAECEALLDEADIVVTNPPFSLFREYVAQLVEHGKHFVIVGPQNAIKYKEVFPLIQGNRLWLGYGFTRGDAYFSIPPENARDFSAGVYDPEKGLVHFRNCTWFTNLDIKKRHEELILVKRYSPEAYQKYANYDAIEVSKVADIPYDYPGQMGVPITFLDKYNPDQFELVGMNWSVLADATLSDDIRRNNVTARRLNFYLPKPDGRGNNYTRMYDRIVIRNRHPERGQGVLL